MLTKLCAAIAALPPIAVIAESLEPGPGTEPRDRWLHLAPLIASARSPVIAALATLLHKPILYIVANSDAALRASEDLRQWLSPDQVLPFPANDTLPYEYMSPGIEVRRQRLRVLQVLSEARQIASETQPVTDELDGLLSGTAGYTSFVIVAPVRALLQPTLTPQEIAFGTTTLRINDCISQDTLLRRWLELGYRVVPMVVEPGDMARRGGIVDIWPATDAYPLRIEWFGDEIDSMRYFDVSTQRSERPLTAIMVGPPHDVPLWKHQQAIARLTKMDVSGLRPESRDEWQSTLARLQAGELFEGWSFFAPFFREENPEPGTASTPPPIASSLVHHLPPSATIIFDEALMLAHLAREYQRQAEEQHAALMLAGELPAGFPRPYLLWDEMLTQADTQMFVDLSNNENIEPELAANDQQPPAAESDMQFSVLDPQFFVLDFFQPATLFGGKLRWLVDTLVSHFQAREHVIVVTPQAARIQELVDDARKKRGINTGRFSAVHGALDGGWRLPIAKMALYTDLEIFGWRQRRSLAERHRQKDRTAIQRNTFLRGLKPGDYVVHIEHGIAIYDGLLRRRIDGVEREYLNLRYAAGDRLYVPVDQVDRVARYVGTGDELPQLTRLGTQEWERAKRRARAAVRDMADELLKIYARRQTREGHAFAADNEWQRELENGFPYIETADQLRALQELKHDMEAPRAMDRLICGDVGFGKTEVALRGAFKAIQDGKQVAVLVPTTVLAQQHFTTFSQRMAAFPVTVEMLSRFRTSREQGAILHRLARGRIDLIVGTHRLLSKDVKFKDLGLLIVDEEQRFGVRHKERLKELRAEVDVLTLTATPIPRTLHMTLTGIRDMSVISTPPEDRVPIKTYVVPYDDVLVRDAIRRELDRGGQVYFVHNRVHNIYHIATHLGHLVPEANIGVAHGQLNERQLEKIMFDFFHGEHDVLVCTTIIENGLDVPNANTIIIDDSPHYGLAQLYQLRGRVGRSAHRAYAYLLYRQDQPLSMEAQQRLQAIQEATELGSGFRIAMRDLEIRGAGNLLGSEQSGHITAIGFDLYSRLLEQAVKQLKTEEHRLEAKVREANGETVSGSSSPPPIIVNEKVLVSPLVTLDLPLTAYLPTDYITDDTVRLGVYQRMAAAQTPEEVRGLRQELRDRFGELPEPAIQLLTWLHLKALALEAGVSSVNTTDEEFIVRLPIMDNTTRERLRRRFGRDTSIKLGPQFVRLDRRALGEQWLEKLTDVLDVLAAVEKQRAEKRVG